MRTLLLSRRRVAGLEMPVHRCAMLVKLVLVCTIATASAAPRRVTLTGRPADTGFGVSVSIPGDLNGDAVADVAVGATTFEYEGDLVPGRVYLYFGGTGFDVVPDLVLNGEANGDRFGYVHSPAGDINGDGHLDLLVGAYQNDANGTNSGRAYIYYGGPRLDALPDLVLTGLTAGELGVAVTGAGDVNADGHDDILIGARFNAAGGFETGRAYVYFGGPAVDDGADLVLDGQAPGERFGFAVAGGHDLNADGHADLVVGA